MKNSSNKTSILCHLSSIIYHLIISGSKIAALSKSFNMDSDLLQMTKEDLIAEVKKLRDGIREHRDSSGQDLCWHHPKLWSLLPEKTDPLPSVPDWPDFLKGCIRYRQSLDEQL